MKKARALQVLMMVIFFWVGTFSSYSQNDVITGKVVDESNEPIPGVSIVFKGTTLGTISDFDGNYSLKKSDKSTVLVFSFVGMSSREIEVNGKSTANVILKIDAIGLEEIVAVGYGIQKKSDVTGAVSTVKMDRMEGKPNANFTQALQGAVAGVNISSSGSNAEGGSVELLIRGRNSVNAKNSPLIVLDGVPFSGSLSDIVPTDIASMSVLKDASSVAIYGSRGSNGVILITTKAGKKGEATFSYNGYYGASVIGKYFDVYNAQEYADWKKERYNADLDGFELERLAAGEFVDWQDEVFRNGAKQEHNVSVRGGSENTTYYVSGTFFNSKGIAENDEFSRYNLRLNLNTTLNDWLSYATNTQLSYLDRSGIPVSTGYGYGMNPFARKYDEDGRLAIYPWPTDTYFGNPFQSVLAQDEDKTYRVITNNSVDVKIPFIPGLAYKLNTGVELGLRDKSTYWGRDTEDGEIGLGETGVGRSHNYLVENIVTYNKEFGKHSIAFTGLYSYQYEKYKSDNLKTEGYANDIFSTYKPETASNIMPSVDFWSTTLLSQMGRLNYNYDNRYLITGTVRRDGFSGFGKDKKYGIFPSLALGWNVHNEDFFNADVISSLKVRLSVGQNGNQAVGPYDNLAKMDDYGGYYSYIVGNTGLPGFVTNTLENSDLGWETTTSYNFGIDFTLLQGRVQGNIDVYHTETSDLLFNRPIPPIHGVSNILQNIGETKNDGIELVLQGSVVESGDFNWNAGLNFAANKNEIVSLYGGNEFDKGAKLFVGEPIRVNYDYVFDGIWQEGDDIANSAQPDAVPGDVKVLDINGDKRIDGEDRQIIGQRDPKWMWGMSNTFTYKNWSLYVFAHGVQGVTKQNDSKFTEPDKFDGRVNFIKRDYWTAENPVNDYPRNNKLANPFGVRSYEKANFIRIKDITLTYELGKEAAKKVGFKILKTYVTGRNLFTISSWDGMDPEFNSQRSVPLQKEYVLGVQLSF